MIESTPNHKQPRLVGQFIRQRREALGLSQRALGLLFNPVVTTQFISNVERGVTPLPPIHIPTLIKALQVSEEELMAIMEQEYTAKLSGRLGKADGQLNGAVGAILSQSEAHRHHSHLVVAPQDYDFMKKLYEAYSQADDQTKKSFSNVCGSLLHTQKKVNAESS